MFSIASEFSIVEIFKVIACGNGLVLKCGLVFSVAYYFANIRFVIGAETGHVS